MVETWRDQLHDVEVAAPAGAAEGVVIAGGDIARGESERADQPLGDIAAPATAGGAEQVVDPGARVARLEPEARGQPPRLGEIAALARVAQRGLDAAADVVRRESATDLPPVRCVKHRLTFVHAPDQLSRPGRPNAEHTA